MGMGVGPENANWCAGALGARGRGVIIAEDGINYKCKTTGLDEMDAWLGSICRARALFPV
jgi:hypothetical protein